ncbi:MAG: proline-rich domain-containing protein [Myxococcota bacterium]
MNSQKMKRGAIWLLAWGLPACVANGGDGVEVEPPGGQPTLPGPGTPGAPANPGNPDPGTPGDPNPGTPDPTMPIDGNPAGPAVDCEVDELSGPAVYGAKLKTLLTGLPLTSDELATLSADASQLETLTDDWMNTPEFRDVLTRFFQGAFQQDQIANDAIPQMLRRNNFNWGRFTGPNEDLSALFVQNLRESFARTALRISEAGEPWTNVLTTDTFEMTTAMVVFHSFLEGRYVNDRNQLRQRAMPEVGNFTLYRNQADAPPAAQAINPNSSNFLHFYVPDFEDLCLPNNQNTYEVGHNAFNGNDEHYFIFGLLVGRPERAYNRDRNNQCRSGNGRTTPILTRADFSDWRTVRLRPVRNNEEPRRFYELPALRNANELAVYTERVGFFTTLGFFGTWPTNEDNQNRVTLNQTLITALGESFDGQTVTDFSPPNLDAEHSAPGTACFGCHQTLDPMREFFTASYSYNYGIQDNQDTMDGLSPQFVFRGMNETGSGMQDLGAIIARHPDFPKAWVQKVCYFANAAPCPENEATFASIVDSFASNLDFKKMMAEVLTSTLVTNDACIEGGTGHQRSISRRNQLCTVLSNRLGVDNICGIGLVNNRRSTIQREVAAAAVSIPQDTYARGEPEPIVITQTGLFTRATREVMCTVVAERAFNAAFDNMGSDEAIERMVSGVMGLPVGDPRHDGALTILQDHYRDGRAEGASERVALQSALVVACMSPGLAGMGF